MKSSDQHFLKLFRNNLVGMIISDEDHIIVDVNEHLLHLTEMNIGDIIGKTGLEIGILNAEIVKNVCQQLMDSDQVIGQELSFTSKSNKRFDILFSTEKIVLDDKPYWLTTIVDISKRKKSEKDLSNIYERVTDAFVAIDKDWHYTYVNKKAGELLEKDPDYLVGQHIWTEFPEDIGQPVYLAYHEAMETQRMITMEEYYEPYDRWFQNLIYPSPDGLSVFFSEITARKHTHDKIKESELRFRTLTKHAPVGIFETDANGATTYVNETWMEFTGMSFEEALGDGFLKAIHPDDRQVQIENWNYKTTKAEPSFSEYRIIDKSGMQRWINGNALPVINETGVVTGYIGTVNDVTGIKNAMQLLEKSEEALNRAQQISKIGNWEFNFLNGELYWSKEQYRIFELQGEPAENLYEAYRKKYHPDDLVKLDEVVKYAVEKGEGYTYEHRIMCNDGSIKFILGIGEVVLSEQGKVIGLKGTGQDITERKKAERVLEERTEQLKELSTHLQNIREDERLYIAREIHDELGQQLTGLKMNVAWLMKKSNREDSVVKAKFDDTLELVDATVKSIRRIATQLRPSIIDDLGLNAALEWLVSEFAGRMKSDIQYLNDFDDKHIKPNISIGLFRILQESLTNIAKHANANLVLITVTQLKETVYLSVVDDGIGFDSFDKQQHRTFGLLGIRERTYMLQGKYDIFTKPGKGTKIEVSIPL